MEDTLFYLGLFLASYWLLTRLIVKMIDLMAASIFAQHAVIKIFLPLLTTVLKILAFLVLSNVLVQYLDLPSAMSLVLGKATSILIIGAISWILFKMVDVGEQLLVHQYIEKNSETLTARKVYTQTHILKRIVYSLIVILTVGAMLMLFDNVRALGASVLTTAGVVGLVITFTAQKSLGSILSSLEIALTQPIRIGDSVMINNEFGTIEEINFRSVVVKLWDWRRLVVPTNYFLENTFQNWSRNRENNLIGTVKLYVDFTLPVQKVRDELSKILSNSEFWDGKINSVAVSELQPQVMQLNILASARNAEDMSSLTNEIREQLIHFIVNRYPNYLPRTRSLSIEKTPVPV